MSFEELCNILTEFTDVPVNEIKTASNLNTDLSLCSYDSMTLIAMIEAKTKTQIDIVELSKNMTVECLLSLINK